MLDSSFVGADSSDEDLEMDTEELIDPFFVEESGGRSKTKMKLQKTEVVNMLDSSFVGADSSDEDLEMDTEELIDPFFVEESGGRSKTKMKLQNTLVLSEKYI